jgi:predicted RNA-binding protein
MITEVDSQVAEILRIFGTRQRFIGTVTKIDVLGHTIHIKSDGNIYLAFTGPDTLGLKPGQLVSYRRDQLRAKEIIPIEPEKRNGTSQEII